MNLQLVSSAKGAKKVTIKKIEKENRTIRHMFFSGGDGILSTMWRFIEFFGAVTIGITLMTIGPKDALYGGMFLGYALYCVFKNIYSLKWDIPTAESMSESGCIGTLVAFTVGIICAWIAIAEGSHLAGVIAGILIIPACAFMLMFIALCFDDE